MEFQFVNLFLVFVVAFGVASAALATESLVIVAETVGDLRVEDVHTFFDAIPGRRKRLVFWAGDHDDWPPEAIQLSVAFINEHTR